MTLKEDEIRPDHLRRGQEERFAADIRRLMEQKCDFVKVPCPACGSADGRATFQKFEMEYQTCVECATLYISPRPTPAMLDQYYATSENYAYWNTFIFPASEDVRREKIFKPRAERLMEICQRHGVAHDTLLEVGAGFGTFCEEIVRLGYFKRVIAVEPTPGLATTCRAKGLEVVELPIEQVEIGSSIVDAIACFEVLEHLFSPAEFLAVCSGLLKERGLLVLSCPNGQGFDVAALGTASDTVDVEHLNYFNPTSIARLVEANGFKVLEVLTPGVLDAELVRKKVLQGAADLSQRPFLRRVLIEEWDRLGAPFQQFLADNRLSSHMWLVAQKVSN